LSEGPGTTGDDPQPGIFQDGPGRGGEACQQQELAQLLRRPAGLGEDGLAGLALPDDELVPGRQDLDVLLLSAHGQEAHERERVVAVLTCAQWWRRGCVALADRCAWQSALMQMIG
jgi:hypothetical protein